jgi:sec-independent protein translocase protein TatA
MFGFGVQELIIIFLIIMVLFGAKKLPGIAKGFGEGIREFKQATKKIGGIG